MLAGATATMPEWLRDAVAVAGELPPPPPNAESAPAPPAEPEPEWLKEAAQSVGIDLQPQPPPQQQQQQTVISSAGGSSVGVSSVGKAETGAGVEARGDATDALLLALNTADVPTIHRAMAAYAEAVQGVGLQAKGPKV